MIDKGQWREFGQDTGVTPLLFTRSAMGFLVTTESQDLGLTSHPKDGAFYRYFSCCVGAACFFFLCVLFVSFLNYCLSRHILCLFRHLCLISLNMLFLNV